MSSSKVGQTSIQPEASTSATQIEGPEPEEHANWQPKLAFANERTFLAWAHFTVLLGAIAVGMLNFHPKVLIVFAFKKFDRTDTIIIVL